MLQGLTDWSMLFMWGCVGASVVLLVVAGLCRVFVTAGQKRTTGRVVGIVGKMGSGKSYAAVRIAEDRLRTGVDVVTNFRMTLDRTRYAGRWAPFDGWDQLALLRDCVVIIDEAHLYAPSHQHVKFPMVARWALAHARKHGLDVIWISQHEDRVNRTLRDLTTSMYLTENMFGGRWFRVTEWEPEVFRRRRRHLTRRWYRRRESICRLYDTSETIVTDVYALNGDRSAAAVRRAERADGVRA